MRYLALISHVFIDFDFLILKNKNLFQILLASGADINALAFDGNTPLHTVIWNANFELVQLLLDSGADVNAQMYFHRWNALHLVAATGQLKIVNILLDAGGDWRAIDNYGYRSYTSKKKLKRRQKVH